jgi:hypothetical protein
LYLSGESFILKTFAIFALAGPDPSGPKFQKGAIPGIFQKLRLNELSLPSSSFLLLFSAAGQEPRKTRPKNPRAERRRQHHLSFNQHRHSRPEHQRLS